MLAALVEPSFIQLIGSPPNNSITLFIIPGVTMLGFSVLNPVPTIVNIAANGADVFAGRSLEDDFADGDDGRRIVEIDDALLLKALQRFGRVCAEIHGRTRAAGRWERQDLPPHRDIRREAPYRRE